MTEQNTGRRLGVVTGGSVTKGIDVRLDSSAPVEEMAVGSYVTIEGRNKRFVAIITDISLGVNDQAITLTPPDMSDPFIAEVLSGTSTYGTLHVVPYLTISGGVTEVLEGPQPVKTIPGHFSPVNLASERDFELVFGGEDERKFFVGNPLDMETKVCLDLEKLVMRSNGIFGKSGTGKTFLTRILLIGMLQKSKAVNLIFDMHNEYGWAGTREGGAPVQGLKQHFPSQVAYITLDAESHLQSHADFLVKIGYDEIEPEDIALLNQTLNLTDLAVEATYQLRRRFGRHWIAETLKVEEGDLAELKIHEATLSSLQRGLRNLGRFRFIEPHADKNAVEFIMENLDAGKNVVLAFGRYRDPAAYVLVANMLARRIYNRYQDRMERATSEAEKPPPLVITIEEAHKFLSREVANQTIFGTIAREMRKYNVTLLIVDQRPSGIDEEVMSQLGTKLTCLLDNERDVDSVLAGVSGKSELKSVLARLNSQQQALIFGHAVPMPVVIKTRDYDTVCRDLVKKDTERKKQVEQDIEKLWG